jgi:outer membrane receptor protein involved in Fe transport
LQQLKLSARFHHPSGFYAAAESLWNLQEPEVCDSYCASGSFANSCCPEGTAAPIQLPTEQFWQHNLYLGYRFPRRHVEVAVGLLNLTDEDYRLHPLNLHADFPRRRAVTLGLKLDF